MTRGPIALASIFVMAVASSAAWGDLQRQTPRAGAAIRGRVVADDTNAPIRDAVVTLRSADRAQMLVPPSGEVQLRFSGPTTRVDAEGLFEFTVAPGRYRLAAEPGPTAARYLPATHPDTASDEPQPLTIDGRQEVENVVIRLPRAAVITGRIVDERGSALAMAGVSVEVMLPGDRRRPLRPNVIRAEDRTDDTGSFRIFGLPPGEYVVVAQAPFLGPTAPELNTTVFPKTYYPGTTAATEALRVRLGPGMEYGPIEFAMTRTRLMSIRGTLVDPNGQPISGVNVTVRRAASEVPTTIETARSGQSQRDGAFEIRGVAPGEYALNAYRFGGSTREHAWLPVVVTDDVEGVVVRMQPGITVRGHVVFEGAAPSSFASLQVAARDGGSRGSVNMSVQPEGDRSFTLEPLFGPTLIRVFGLTGWHLKSVMYGAGDITDQPTEFVSGGPPLQVILTQRAATLRGTVTTTKGIPIDAAVVLFAEDPALWNERATTTRTTLSLGDGHYTLQGIRAGRYLAVAVSTEDVLARTTPAYFELLAKSAVPVVIGESESKSLNLTLTPIR